MDSSASRNLLVGGIICVVGIVVTAYTYLSAASSPEGGSYVVAWGAILFGGIQFVRGLFGVMAGE